MKKYIYPCRGRYKGGWACATAGAERVRGNGVGGGYNAKNHITAMPKPYEVSGGLAEWPTKNNQGCEPEGI